MARLAHLNQIERPETERSEAFSIAAAQRKTAAKKFYDSVFYTIVLPNNIVGNNVLSFSKCAYNVLGNNEAANAFFDKMNCKMLCLDTAPTPHIDRNSDNEPFIMTFTKLERAKEYLDYTRRLLADFEANTEEEKNKCAESICRLREISCCEICAMTGKEIAENTVNSNYEFVLINNSQSLLYRSIEMCVAEE